MVHDIPLDGTGASVTRGRPALALVDMLSHTEDRGAAGCGTVLGQIVLIARSNIADALYFAAQYKRPTGGR